MNRMNRILPVVVLLMGWCLAAPRILAQTVADTSVIVLNGKVTDALKGEPVPMASVTLDGSAISIVSNADGDFSLKVTASVRPEAQVVVKAMGFRTGRIPVTAFLSQPGGESSLNIPLVPASIELTPAVILGYDALELFRSAFESTWSNCLQKRMGMTAFYREFIRKGSRYLVLNEAVVDIDKAAPHSLTGDRVAIYKGRGNEHFSIRDSLMMRFQGGIVSALDIDQVSHPFTGLTLEEVAEFYDFRMGGTAMIGEKAFCMVEFSQKAHVEGSWFRGTVFIEPESLAVGRIEFSMNVEDNPLASRVFLVKKPADYDVVVDEAHYLVNYREKDGLWYFDYSRTELSFTTRFRKSPFRSRYYVTTELAVTDHKQGDFTIEKNARFFMKDVLSQKVADFQDDNFWGAYNVIEPDQNIETCIQRIIRRLQSRP